jgi:hypothetical protein
MRSGYATDAGYDTPESILARALPAAPERSWLDLILPAAVALAVIGFACGSSSVYDVTRVGRDVRWVFLLLVLGAAGAILARRRTTSCYPLHVVGLAAALVAVALVSVAWSLAPRLTFERTVTLAVLFLTCLLLALSTGGERAAVERLLVGLLAGATLVAVAGLLVLAAAPDDALQRATTGVPTRYRGLGENANTAALLYSVVIPISFWTTLAARTTAQRLGAVSVLLLVSGSTAFSGSRGALFAGFVSAAALGLVSGLGWLRRVIFAGVALALLAVTLGISQVPQPARARPVSAPVASGPTAPPPRYVNVENVFPLEADVGRSLPGGYNVEAPRGFFDTSGRLRAWKGTAVLIGDRPALGYGFGTEERAFIPRYYDFSGGLPENSYLGIGLQLGGIGLALFTALVVSIAVAGTRALRRLHGPVRLVAAACGAGMLAGLIAAIAQSYLVSVGDIATLPFWLCAFLFATPLAEAR